jgi:hypothetical protein
MRQAAVKAVFEAGVRPLVLSPKRRMAAPLLSTSTTNSVSVGPADSRSGAAVHIVEVG